MEDETAFADPSINLVGGPFAVLESDPAVFTTLMRKLGLGGLEMAEVYDIEPWATEHLSPRGLIFCYPCEADREQHTDSSSSQNPEYVDLEPDPDAQNVWYAHQLSSDACASQAILNVVLNLDGVRMTESIRRFADDTRCMDPVMRGLAVTNCDWIREAHNSLARPADIRGALHAVAKSTLEYQKKQKAAAKKSAEGPPAKRRKTGTNSARKTKSSSANDVSDAFHFIGYVPAHGRVWELDGLRYSGPLEVGEIPQADSSTGLASSKTRWMDIARPAIKRRMQNLMLSESENIRFNLLAIVDDKFEKASDDLEMLKRERIQLERRLNTVFPNGWSDKVDGSLYEARLSVFRTTVRTEEPGPVFGRDFASKKLERDMFILDLPERALIAEWTNCLNAAMSTKVIVEEELANATNTNTEHINRTFDYEPFIQSFITSLHNEGLLERIISPNK